MEWWWYLIKKIVFVSIDKPERWSRWHSSSTDSVYYSDFLANDEEVDRFIEQVNHDYPDNNLIDGTIGKNAGHEFFIEYVVLDFNENNEDAFNILKHMIGAYETYNNRRFK